MAQCLSIVLLGMLITCIAMSAGREPVRVSGWSAVLAMTEPEEKAERLRPSDIAGMAHKQSGMRGSVAAPRPPG